MKRGRKNKSVITQNSKDLINCLKWVFISHYYSDKLAYGYNLLLNSKINMNFKTNVF